jgi:MFS family permease
MAAFLLANFVATIFLTWTPTFLAEKFDFRLSTAGLSGSVFIHLASAFSVPFGGLLADRLARRMAGGRICVQAIGLLLGSLPIVFVGMTGNVAVLLLSMTIFGACKGLYDANIFASLYDVIDPRARATAAGFMNTIGWGGGALGPLFVGWSASYGRRPTEMQNMSEAIAWCGAVYLAGACVLGLAMLSMRKRTRDATPHTVSDGADSRPLSG